MKLRSRRAPVRKTLVALALVITGSVGCAAQTEAAPIEYVALGDSYSAASGVLPLDSGAPIECLRSSRNYPHLLAKKLGADLTDVTCGAAETSHFAGSQYPGVSPQLDAVSAGTDLVTMTIGGNDSGVFIGAIAACGTAGLATLGQGSPCKDLYGSTFEDTVRNTTYPSIVNALKAVRAKAPQATVAILTYPWITPATEGCFPVMPVAKGDVPYVRSLQGTLNDVIRRAAEDTGATLVNLNQASNGHDACQASGMRWIEPVLTGTNPVIVHPNALGESKMAEETFKVLSEDRETTQPPVPVRPRTRITRVRIRSAKRKATFRFRSDQVGSDFRCRLDRKKFRPCSSPKYFRKLKPGRHVFRVVAESPAGLRDRSAATFGFRIAR
jgi:lysophospholipase L1-like esterase